MLVVVGFIAMFLLGFAVGESQGAGLHGIKLGGGAFEQPPEIASVIFGTPFQYNVNNWPTRFGNGDGWSVTWADDDALYVNIDDSPKGFDGLLFPNGANTMFGKISAGPNPGATDWNSGLVIDNWPSATTTMAATGWGTFDQCTAPDNSSHKIAGVISVHGVMYAHGWRLRCSGGGTNQWQLLKSTDHARTWTPVPPGNAQGYQPPMFNGGITPMGFIQYGKDYELAGLASEGKAGDNSDKYVYAMVLDNFPSLVSRRDQWLARCLISKIGDQNAADWQFFKAPPGSDGMLDSNWGTREEARVDTATGKPGTLVHIDTPGTAGQLFIYYWNPVYLPAFKQYLAVNVSRVPINSQWTPYVAPHPWGPWRKVDAANNTFLLAAGRGQLAFPNPVTKSLTVDGGHTLTVFGSGDCCVSGAHNDQNGVYTLFVVPATIYEQPAGLAASTGISPSD